ncbi:MAG: DUF1987 domain-containing protein [Salibacteraceae bacterium]
MEIISIEATDETPAVTLDASSNTFDFSGKSLPEDVSTFYNPILDWFDSYSLNPNETTVVDFKLTYFNTASSKCILDILMKLEEISEEGNSAVTINWHYQEDDEDMEEAGEEYADIVDIPFEMMPY